MADSPKPPKLAEQIAWRVHAKLDAWRRSRKFSSVIVMEQHELFLMGKLDNYVPYAEVDEVAKHLDCQWAYNPMKRVFFFIPYELFGEER